jgi:hypothetical protein
VARRLVVGLDPHVTPLIEYHPHLAERHRRYRIRPECVIGITRSDTPMGKPVLGLTVGAILGFLDGVDREHSRGLSGP